MSIQIFQANAMAYGQRGGIFSPDGPRGSRAGRGAFQRMADMGFILHDRPVRSGGNKAMPVEKIEQGKILPLRRHLPEPCTRRRRKDIGHMLLHTGHGLKGVPQSPQGMAQTAAQAQPPFASFPAGRLRKKGLPGGMRLLRRVAFPVLPAGSAQGLPSAAVRHELFQTVRQTPVGQEGRFCSG